MPAPPKRIFQARQELGTSIVSFSSLRSSVSNCGNHLQSRGLFQWRAHTVCLSFPYRRKLLIPRGIMSIESLMRRTRSAIGEIELDLGRYELRRQGQRVKLEKKPMELLIFLVSRREQLVSRQEIVSKLWGSD